MSAEGPHVPQISVILPVYCAENTVERAIRSVLSQDMKDLEILVIDDGSHDGTADVVRGIDDPRIRLIRQENQGEGGARNRGIHMAQAPLLAFIDGDDEWLPGHLSRVLDLLAATPEARVCVMGYQQIDRAGQAPWSTRETWERAGLRLGPFRCEATSSPTQLLTQLAYMNPWTTTVYRSTALKHGGFWERCSRGYGLDAWFMFLLLLNETVLFDDHHSAIYHHEASKLTRFRRAHGLEPFLAAVDAFESRCPETRRPMMRKVLALRALQTARHFALYGKGRSARILLRRHACARHYPFRTLFTLLLTGLAPLAEQLRPLYYGLKKSRGHYVPEA